MPRMGPADDATPPANPIDPPTEVQVRVRDESDQEVDDTAPWTQWVNLPRRQVLAEQGIASIAHLGEWVGLKFELKQADAGAFKVRIKPGGGNAVYTAREQTASGSYRFIQFQTPAYDAAKGVANQLFKLTGAGGDTYTVEGKLRGKTATGTITIETRRRIFYHVLAVNGISNAPDAGFLRARLRKTAKHFIHAVAKPASTIAFGFDADTNFNPGIAAEQRQLFTVAASKVAQAGLPAPVTANSMTIVYLGYMHQPASRTITLRVRLNQAAAGLWQRTAAGIVVTLPNHVLWHGFDAADDAADAWLESIDGCQFVPDPDPSAAATPAPVAIGLARSAVSLDPSGRNAHGRSNKFIIASSDPRFSATSQEGRLVINLTIRTASAYSNGLGYVAKRLALVRTRNSAGDYRTAAEIVQTSMHELGHLLMIPGAIDPAGAPPPPARLAVTTWNIYNHLDAHAHAYSARWNGHTGVHCANGVAWDGTHFSGAIGCVLFGSNGFTDAAGTFVERQTASYCAECIKHLRKRAAP